MYLRVLSFYWHWRRRFLGHFKRHFGPQISSEWNWVISSEWSQYLQQKWFWYSLLMGESSVHDRLFCRHLQSGSAHSFSKTRSRSNVWKEHTHTEGHKCEKTHLLLQIWVYSLRITLFGWFWLYLSHKMSYKISQEFPTASLDITDTDKQEAKNAFR